MSALTEPEKQHLSCHRRASSTEILHHPWPLPCCLSQVIFASQPFHLLLIVMDGAAEYPGFNELKLIWSTCYTHTQNATVRKSMEVTINVELSPWKSPGVVKSSYKMNF